MGPVSPSTQARRRRVLERAVRIGTVLAPLACVLVLAACAGEDSAPTPGTGPGQGTVPGPAETAGTPAPASGRAADTATPGVQPDGRDGTPGVKATAVPTRKPPPETPSEAPQVPSEMNEGDVAGDIRFEDLEIVTLLPYDGIPAILDPAFVSAEEAWYQYASDETVLGLSINGDHRAYSVPYLSSREIVNDVVGGVPVAVTW